MLNYAQESTIIRVINLACLKIDSGNLQAHPIIQEEKE